MDYRSLFEALNERLKDKGRQLTITCGGGFALMINDIRATTDIDAFYEEDSWLLQQIKEVGDQFAANTSEDLWLNSSIKTFNKIPQEDVSEEFMSYSNLTVRVVSLKYLLGMKLQSGREKDITDAAVIIKQLNITNPVSVLKDYSDFNFDSSDVIWAFEQAYGEEWVSNYLLKHREEIEKYFR